MLGEGYDLPNLKIAAIHDYHKSLAITLQFIGRFTRVSNKETLGSASVVVNIADPGVEGALLYLYKVVAKRNFTAQLLGRHYTLSVFTILYMVRI